MKGRTLDGIIGIQFKGKIHGIEKAFGGLVQMQRSLGPDTLMIETIPTPEIPGNLFYVRFKGGIDDFMKVDGELKDLKSTLAIDTVPLQEHHFIGTWPTPETPSDANIWYITFG